MRKPQKQDFVTEKPVLADFGMNPQDYEQAKARQGYPMPPRLYWTCAVGFLTSLLAGIIYDRSGSSSQLMGFVLVASPMAFAFVFTFARIFLDCKEWLVGVRGIDSRRSTDPQFDRVQRYEVALARYNYGLARYKAAMAAYSHTLEEHWKSLKGTALEDELATLYRKVGYTVRTTRATGDRDVDLILERNGQTIIVQSKGYEKPAGVGVARDLYGALMDVGAHSAVLICPSGFTKGVSEFVCGKPIELIDAHDLIGMAESLERGASSQTHVAAQGVGYC